MSDEHKCPNCGAFPVERPGPLERNLTAAKDNLRTAKLCSLCRGRTDVEQHPALFCDLHYREVLRANEQAEHDLTAAQERIAVFWRAANVYPEAPEDAGDHLVHGAITEGVSLRAEVADLEMEKQVLADCLNGSNKAVYTAEMYDKLRAEVERLPSIELAYRRELWLNHGHTGQYGDDGEMQCCECLRYGLFDYKREPLEKVEKACFMARMERAKNQMTMVDDLRAQLVASHESLNLCEREKVEKERGMMEALGDVERLTSAINYEINATPGAVRVRESNGPEDVCASLAVSMAKTRAQLAALHADDTGHLHRCVKVNGVWSCADGCAVARAVAAEAKLAAETQRAEGASLRYDNEHDAMGCLMGDHERLQAQLASETAKLAQAQGALEAIQFACHRDHPEVGSHHVWCEVATKALTPKEVANG